MRGPQGAGIRECGNRRERAQPSILAPGCTTRAAHRVNRRRPLALEDLEQQWQRGYQRLRRLSRECRSCCTRPPGRSPICTRRRQTRGSQGACALSPLSPGPVSPASPHPPSQQPGGRGVGSQRCRPGGTQGPRGEGAPCRDLPPRASSWSAGEGFGTRRLAIPARSPSSAVVGPAGVHRRLPEAPPNPSDTSPTDWPSLSQDLAVPAAIRSRAKGKDNTRPPPGAHPLRAISTLAVKRGKMRSGFPCLFY